MGAVLGIALADLCADTAAHFSSKALSVPLDAVQSLASVALSEALLVSLCVQLTLCDLADEFHLAHLAFVRPPPVAAAAIDLT